MHKRAGNFCRSNDNREVRQLRRELAKVTREKRGEDGSLIRGVSAVFYRENDPGTEYWLWSDMVERIHPGTFDRAIKEAHDARALFNHNSDNLLGRVSSGTCRLSVTDVGLAYEIDVNEADPDHTRVCSKLDRGDVTGSSFAFMVARQTWEEEKTENGWIYIRNIYDVDLFDVGPVTWPAYEATTAGRSTDAGSSGGSSSNRSELQSLIAEREAFLRGFDDEDVAMRLRMIDVS